MREEGVVTVAVTEITPEGHHCPQFIVETPEGFYWTSDGYRSNKCFPSFLEVVRFAMDLHDREAERVGPADEIVFTLERILTGHGEMSWGELLKWIVEWRISYRAHTAEDEVTLITDDFFAESENGL